MNVQKPSKEHIVTRDSSAPPSVIERRIHTSWAGAGVVVVKVLLLAAPMRTMRYA
jgi:hypothetical protein